MLAKRKQKRKIYNKIKKISLYVLGIALILFLAYQALNLFLEGQELEKNMNTIKEEKERVAMEIETLKFSLGETYSDAYLEKVAREEMSLQKPGEKIIVIKKEGEGGDTDNSAEETSFIQKVADFFNNIFGPE